MAKEDQKQGQAPISVNTFTRGMNKDISKYAIPADQYYDASNVRIVADSSKESGALVNVQGNDFAIQIPCSPAVFEIVLDPNAALLGVAWTSTVTIAVATPVGTDMWTITLGGTGGNPIQSLADVLESPAGAGWFLNGVANAAGPSNIAGTLPGFYWIFDASSKRIVIWGKPNLPNPLTQGNTLNTGTLVIQQVITVSMTGGFTILSQLATPQCAVSVIGYAVLRDSIYLFTTGYDGGDPSSNGGPGQIWELTVLENVQNTAGIISYLECIYTRDLCINFTKQHPIEAIGRYEKIDIQGIYWTDNFNPPRKLNVANADAMATPCEFLDLAPKTGFSIPILNQVATGGNLLCGVYQLAYRYKNAEGLVSDWSPLSNLVPVYESSDTDPYCNISGGEFDMLTKKGTQSNKRIRWQLNNLDTAFEFLELCAIYHIDDVPGNEQIYIFSELTNGLTNLVVEHTGSEEFIPLTFTDFTTGIGATFEKVKTLSSKDNKLFFGNIVNTTFNVDYDARSYRFNAAQLAQLDSLSDLPVVINGTTPYAPGAGETAIDLVPEQHDAINPFNDENPATNANWFTNDQYTFQLDGATLGGSGHNVSYTFIRQQNEEDTIDNSVGHGPTANVYYTDHVNCTTTQVNPNRACFYAPQNTIGGSVSLGVPGDNYNMNNTYDNYKSPYKWSLYGAYARGETYRFGIVFYNNKGQASFVNWIGDIKIPFSYTTGLGNPFGFFHVSNWVGSPGSPTMLNTNDSLGNAPSFPREGTLFTNNIGIQFSVNLDPATSGIDIAALGITGFSIVRCDRKNNDKSKFGHGLAHTLDRLRMDEGEWAGMTNPQPNLWGGGNDEDIIIPSCGLYPSTCGGPIIAYMDAATGNASGVGNQCDLMPWNTGGGLDLGYDVCQTRKSELLLYGPLGWKNSDPTNTGNLNTGLGIDTAITSGDYIKIESVMAPQYNIGMNMDNWVPGGLVWRLYSNSWYKYYYGATMVGGVFGSNASALNYTYLNGVPSVATTQDPANSKQLIDWGSHVGDGLFIPETSDTSLEFSFMNASHPGGEFWTGMVWSPGDNWVSSRPQSIGSECFLLTLNQANQWQGANYLMGASLDAFATTTTVPNYRAIFSYEKYVVPYGGNTYANRSNSTYISTGHFYPILPLTLLTVPLVSQCWGGDTQCQLYDFTQYEKNWGQSGFENWDSLDAQGWSMPSNSGDAQWGVQWNCIFPTEAHMTNVLWRSGYHFNNKGGSGNAVPNNGTNLHDDMQLMAAYYSTNDVRSYFPKPLNVSFGEEFDTRVYYSETKINGEANDSWAVFLQNNYKDVEGVYGPLNKLIRLHDTMYYFQDTGFGALSVNPTAMVQAADGTSLQLGTVSTGAGAFIQSYKYISTLYGAKQQWAVTHSDNALYFFDINQRKMFTYSGEGTMPVSDIVGLHSYFQDNLVGSILVKDNPILKEGISCVYDAENNEVLFTFHDQGYSSAYEMPIVNIQEGGAMPNRILALTVRPDSNTCDDCFTQDCDDYFPAPVTVSGWVILTNILLNADGPFTGFILGKFGCPALPIPVPNPLGHQIGDILLWIPEAWNSYPPGIQPPARYSDIDISTLQTLTSECGIGTNSFTVGYNELVKGYTSFYDFHPSIYINSGRFLITPNTQNPCMSPVRFGEDQLYMHGVGTYGKFYDMIYQSSVTLTSNLESSVTKVFDNVSFHMESLWLVGRQDEEQINIYDRTVTGLNSGLPSVQNIDIKNNTFDKIRFYTDYQMSDYITLVPGTGAGTNIRKVEREWQTMVARNIMDENLVDADIFNVFNYNPTKPFKDRMRDKYLFIDLIYNNFDTETGEPRNIKFILHYFKTFFRPSYR